MGHLDKGIGILIVDPVSGVASTVKRVLQELGYKNIFQVDSVMDGLNTLSTQNISWIFTSLFEGQKYNAYHFLRLPLEFENFRHVMTSVLLNADEFDQGPFLYSLGMVSSHVRPITYNSFKAEIDRFLGQLKANPDLPIAVAAELRIHLGSSIDDLERLELGLYRWVDQSPEQRLRLIETQLKAGNNLEGLLGLKQLLAQQPSFGPAIAALSKKYLAIDDIEGYRTAINVNLAVVVDSDEAQQKFLADTLKELGVRELKLFSTPAEAIELLKTKPEVDLLITEWKLKGMEGAGFIQHAKLGALREKPLVIFSSLVEESDHKLIAEVGGCFILRKPLTKKAFKEELSDIFARWRYPVEGEDIEQKIYQSLQAGDRDYAQKLLAEFENLPKVEKQRKTTLQAAFAYYAGDFLQAKALIIEASKIKLPTHREIGWLGKILLKLGEFADAQRCLDQANQMVPGNVERLCQMADVNAALGKGEETLEVINEARDLAGDVGMVTTTFARHAAALGKANEAQAYMADESVARGVVAHMNNLGVAYASVGKWKESIEAYVKSLKALGKLHEDLQATVLYNLGLSLVRQNRYKEALPVLKQAHEKGSLQLAKKALQLRDKVSVAIDTVSTITLKEAPREIEEATGAPTPPVDALIEYVGQAPFKPGEHALFGVFVASEGDRLDLTTEFPRIIKNTA